MQAHIASTQQYADAHQVQPQSLVVDTIEGAIIGAYMGWLFGPMIKFITRMLRKAIHGVGAQ